MNKVTVKICGLKTESDVIKCMKPGVDILGFVTEYPVYVPWNLSCMEARELLSLVRLPFKSCLVTGGSPEKIIELAESLRPSIIQLHFKETLNDTIKISQALKLRGIDTIKTIPVMEEERIHQFGTSNLEHIVKSLCETEIYGILVDSRTPSNAAEKGTQIAPAFYTQIKSLSSKPVILAGGIIPDNVTQIIEQTKAEFIDVMTGVEKAPGVKDEIMLTNMLSNIGNRGMSRL